jgi:hypothetical protein
VESATFGDVAQAEARGGGRGESVTFGDVGRAEARDGGWGESVTFGDVGWAEARGGGGGESVAFENVARAEGSVARYRGAGAALDAARIPIPIGCCSDLVWCAQNNRSAHTYTTVSVARSDGGGMAVGQLTRTWWRWRRRPRIELLWL